MACQIWPGSTHNGGVSTLSGRRADTPGEESRPLSPADDDTNPGVSRDVASGLDDLIGELPPSVRSLESVVRAGLVDPGHLMALGFEASRWGATIATPIDAAGRRFANRRAVIDDYGTLSYADLKRRSERLAGGMVRAGFTRFDRIALACTNHRGFVEALTASARLGCRVVLVNPALGGTQLAQVVQSEGVSVVIHDVEISDVVAASVPGALSIPVDPARDSAWSFPTIDPAPFRRRSGSARHATLPVLMTSGTTGVPKGAERDTPPPDLVASTGLLQMIPYRTGDTAIIASPLFHAWGLANLTMMLTLAGTVVLARSFDAERVLDAIDEHRPRVLTLVPIMLGRLLDARSQTGQGNGADSEEAGTCPTAEETLSIPEVVASSGSAIRPSLVRRWLEECDANLYNLYGSTEVGQATIAGPADLALHPDTAGRVVPGSRVEVLHGDGQGCQPMETGAIFVGSTLGFSSYTDGADKERVDGLTSSGDTGYFDDDGRLFVLGREDDMIISGGENVFPGEIEELLLGHPDVDDVAVVGVPDEEFGERLAAHIVKRSGARLTKAQVRKHVRSTLAPYKVPRDIHWLKSLPRTTTGKVQRQRLRQQK